jgi:tetratricopeptide (TPR) repeat protein
MTPATNRGAIFSVALALLLLFAFTTALNSAYRNTRAGRGEERYKTGIELSGHREYERAAEEFRAALTYVHNEPRYRMALARCLIELGQWNEAETYLSELREDDPTSGPINLALARIATRQQRPTDAVTYYQRAIYGFWPDHPTESRTAARFELAGFFERSGQEKQILAELLDLADETPGTNTASRRRIAEMLLAHGSPQHAAELFRDILESSPHDGAAEKGFADTQFALGDYVEARKAYRAASRDGLRDADIANKIAACDAVIDLDPTIVRLSAGQRFARAQALVKLTSQAALSCGSLPADLADSANKAASESAVRRRDGDTLTMLALAERLWKNRQDTCSAQSKTDPALSAVMAKLQKQ